jgi:uncharacterized protein YhhL (DUF1145 family)
MKQRTNWLKHPTKTHLLIAFAFWVAIHVMHLLVLTNFFKELPPMPWYNYIRWISTLILLVMLVAYFRGKRSSKEY